MWFDTNNNISNLPEIYTKNDSTSHLLYASLLGLRDTILYLLEGVGLSVNQVDKLNRTPLQAAALLGRTSSVRLLLENGADVTIANDEGWTPLELASFYGHDEVAKLLIENGADVNFAGIDEVTPLYFAAYRGNIGVVKLLLENGAVMKYPNNSEWTPLDEAISKGHLDVIELLLEKSVEFSVHSRKYWNLFQAAAQKGSHSLMQLLIENAKNVDMQNSIFEDALHLACIEGYAAIVEQLIHLGVDPNKADEHGWAPLLCASWSGQGQILDYLSSTIGYVDSLPPIKTIPPSSWSAFEKSTCLELDEDMTCVRYTENSGTANTPAALVIADHPVPLRPGGYYYEIKILNSGDSGVIGMGLCSRYVSLESLPGWEFVSWGYHGDDGKKFTDRAGTPYGPTFKTGDIIGCNVQLKGDIFFTLNGNSLGVAFQGVSGKICPAVGMRSRGAHVRANFGRAVFRYDVTKS